MSTHKTTVTAGSYRTSHPEVWNTEDVEYYLTHTPQTKPFQDVLRPEQVEKFSYSTGMDKTAEIQTPERPYSHTPQGCNSNALNKNKLEVALNPEGHTLHYQHELSKKLWQTWLRQKGVA